MVRLAEQIFHFLDSFGEKFPKKLFFSFQNLIPENCKWKKNEIIQFFGLIHFYDYYDCCCCCCCPRKCCFRFFFSFHSFISFPDIGHMFICLLLLLFLLVVVVFFPYTTFHSSIQIQFACYKALVIIIVVVVDMSYVCYWYPVVVVVG